MTAVIFRRRRLGLTSCRGIVGAMEERATYARADQPRRWPDDTSLVIRWGCTARIPVECNRVLNSVDAIHFVNNKSAFRILLDEHGLCPRTWVHEGEQILDIRAYYDRFPVVVRPNQHAQGRMLFVCNDADELSEAVRRCGPYWYASELIDKSAEYRVFVAQGRAVWVARKTPGNPGDVAWNVAQGGRFDNVRWGDWPLKVVKNAIEAFNLSGLDFGGVDVIVDADGNPYTIEINSAPSQTSPYRQGCVARVFDYIVRNGKGNIPLITERGGWRKFIHPALSEETQVGDT